jgi:hypothetical protein
MDGVSIAGVGWSGPTSYFNNFVDLGPWCYLLLGTGGWSTELMHNTLIAHVEPTILQTPPSSLIHTMDQRLPLK